MRIRTVRSLATASLFAAGLATWSGCNAENPDGTPTTVGKMEKGAADLEHKAVEEIKKDAKAVGEGVKKGVAKTGEVIEHAGEKLENEGKDAVEKHLGETAGKVAEKTGEALDKAGEKIQDSVKPKD